MKVEEQFIMQETLEWIKTTADLKKNDKIYLKKFRQRQLQAVSEEIKENESV